MVFLSVLSQAQRWVSERVAPGDGAIDATAGGGVDTLFLARAAGAKGRVFAFDVQQEALEATQARLAAAEAAFGAEAETPPSSAAAGGKRLAAVELIHAGHEHMAAHVPIELHGRIAAVMFNLGYFPGGADLTVITEPATTLKALDAALNLLRKDGILTAVLYPGHPGGREEADTVERWFASVPGPEAQTVLYRFSQRQSAAYLAALIKK